MQRVVQKKTAYRMKTGCVFFQNKKYHILKKNLECASYGIRIRVYAVRGRRPRPLDEGDLGIQSKTIVRQKQVLRHKRLQYVIFLESEWDQPASLKHQKDVSFKKQPTIQHEKR